MANSALKANRVARMIFPTLGRPNFSKLGVSFESSRRIASEKSAWMVYWLRARRNGDKLRSYYLKMHFSEKNPEILA